MGSNMPQPESSPRVPELDNVRPTMVKAGLAGTAADASVGAVIAAAVEKHYGSVKAAAISLRIDRSQMQRDFARGRFACLEKADPETKAAIADAVHQAFGTLAHPKQYARRTIREIRQRLDALAEYVEFIE